MKLVRPFICVGGLILGLAACQPAPDAAPPSSGLTLVPAPGGLLVRGSGGREIGFGRDQQGVLESVARVEGVAPRSVPCQPGMQGFATTQSIRLNFAGGTFVGWDTIEASVGRSCS